MANNFCEKHHLSFNGARCPMCEKERINDMAKRCHASHHNPVGLAPRQSYFEEYAKKEEPDLAEILSAKFNVGKL